MVFLLDSNAFSDLMRKDRRIEAQLQARMPDNRVVPVAVTVAALYPAGMTAWIAAWALLSCVGIAYLIAQLGAEGMGEAASHRAPGRVRIAVRPAVAIMSAPLSMAAAGKVFKIQGSRPRP